MRVWKGHERYPGLAMTRSIGDRKAKNIGICSDPIITQYDIDLSNDLFFVMASDGVWDTMNN